MGRLLQQRGPFRHLRDFDSNFPHKMGDSAYSFSLTTFSPSGKLVQIEYALNAVASGATSLGVKAKNGVVIATEKKVPSILIDETSVQKILMLTENIAIVYSGMGVCALSLARPPPARAPCPVPPVR